MEEVKPFAYLGSVIAEHGGWGDVIYEIDEITQTGPAKAALLQLK